VGKKTPFGIPGPMGAITVAVTAVGYDLPDNRKGARRRCDTQRGSWSLLLSLLLRFVGAGWAIDDCIIQDG
jgi:hypothetical protein